MKICYLSVTIVLSLLCCTANAQADIVPGRVWIITKPGYQQAYKTDTAVQRMVSNGRVADIKQPHPANTLQKTLKSLTDPSHDLSRIQVIYFDNDANVDSVCRAMMKLPWVQVAEPQYQMQLFYEPNDPFVPVQPGVDNAWHLHKIQAPDAWDIQQGDPNIIIGVLDTGADTTHPELKGQLYRNPNDIPGNGMDDDGDGLTDNYWGWDFADGDNNPYPDFSVGGGNGVHGTRVIGACSATPNNNEGLAGTGLYCRYMPIKIFQSSTFFSYYEYQAIAYAAELGCKVINCSWGGTVYSAVGEYYVNYAVDAGSVVVAAAGNSGQNENYYPAAYDNVISVTATDENDARWHASTVSPTVDMSAPGEHIYLPVGGGFYNSSGGTSFASPMVAGAAAIILSQYPLLAPVQVMELLKASTDPIDNLSANMAYAGLMGTGRLNMYKALTYTGPGIHIDSDSIVNTQGATDVSNGDTCLVYFDFTNVLNASTAGLTFRLRPYGSGYTILDSVYSPGAMGSLQSGNNYIAPFRVVITNNPGTNATLYFKLVMQDAAYYNLVYIDKRINSSYKTISTNSLKMTVASDARYGYADYDFQNVFGLGLTFKGNNILYEGGFAVGASGTEINDNIRVTTAKNDDFNPTRVVNYYPVQGTETLLMTEYTTADAPDLLIRQRAYTVPGADSVILMDYRITNTTGVDRVGVHCGMFFDFDISDYLKNKASVHSQYPIGMCYHNAADSLYGAVAVYEADTFGWFMIDNQVPGGTNINIVDNFSDNEKFQALSTRRHNDNLAAGGDVSMMAWARLDTLKAGQTRLVSFGVIVAKNKAGVVAAYQQAKPHWDSIHKPVAPVVQDTISLCGTGNFSIQPTGASQGYYFYQQSTTSTLLKKGTQYDGIATQPIERFASASRDSLIEGFRAITVIVTDTLTGGIVATPEGGNPLMYTFTYNDNTADYNWTNTDGGTGSASSFVHTFSGPGQYFVNLTVETTYGCTETYQYEVNIVPTGASLGSEIVSVSPNPATNTFNVQLQTEAQLKVYKTDGTLQGDYMLKKGVSAISCDAWSRGLYVLQLETSSGVRIIKLLLE